MFNFQGHEKRRALIQSKIVDVPDYPLAGVSFKDITPLLADGKAFKAAIDELVAFAKDLRPDYVIGPEARGFMFGTVVADRLGCGFIPARKANKLPRESVVHHYEMEYGRSSLAIHKDALQPGARVLIVDDLLASGGTATACVELVKKLGGQTVGYACVILLENMDGLKALEKTMPVFWCVKY